MKKLLPVIIVCLGVFVYDRFIRTDDIGTVAAVSDAGFARANDSDSDGTLAAAYRSRQSNVQVEGNGIVARLLPDDSNGSRHQRFILRLDSGQTLLVAHNIDLAPRIRGLGEGDSVRFFGEYEWNDRGGVIHWTHSDPAGRHIAGWLEHGGTRYQ